MGVCGLAATRASPPTLAQVSVISAPTCASWDTSTSHTCKAPLSRGRVQSAPVGCGCGNRPEAWVAQRSTRAPPPPASLSTSVLVAMVVSPGVVMASAPWAAPYSTAVCSGSPSNRP